MASDQLRPDASGEPAAGATGEQVDRPPAGTAERFGPLRIVRLRKDDGRTLILFSRFGDGEAAQ
jgi:hypothetical protein